MLGCVWYIVLTFCKPFGCVWKVWHFLFLLQGNIVGAEAWFNKAKQIDPEDTSLCQHYGKIIYYVMASDVRQPLKSQYTHP